MIDINTIKNNNYTESGFKQFDPKIGKHAEYAYKALKNKGWDDKAINDQLGKALEVISFCNPRHAARKQSTQGLVMGKVQSGKTTSFSLVSALAADNGYKIIIQFLGTTNLLVEDNFRDVKRLLGLKEDDLNNDLDWWYPQQVGKFNNTNGVKYPTNQMITAIANRGGILYQNHSSKVLYFYCIKKTDQIKKITKLVKDIKNKKDCPPELPVLIIDDEVDSYSLNIKKDANSISPTYDALSDLKNACGEVTYIGYTATSQALYLAHDNSFLRPDAYAVLKPGKDYVGNYEIFGETSHLHTPLTRPKSKQQRHQPVEIDPMDYKNNLRRDGSPKDYDMKRLRESLKEPIIDFLVSWSFNWERNEGDIPPMSMMLTPATTSRINGHIPTKLMAMVDPWVKSELRNILTYLMSPSLSNIRTNIFKKIYDKKKTYTPKGKSVPSLNKSKELIKELLATKGYEVATVNQSGTANITADNALAWFIIGGVKLSRGFVVPDLLTTWMPFQAKSLTMDTTEQRGRFFGYKKNYLDLISVYAQSETINLLEKYSSIENHLFESVEKGAKNGTPFSSSDTNWVLFDSAHPLTSASKNRTKKFKRVSSSWHTSLHSPFNNNNGLIEKNLYFNHDIQNFLGKLNLKNISSNKYGIVRNSPQDALHARLSLDQVYNSFLVHLRDHIDNNDSALRGIIDAIGTSYQNKGWKCDVIYFDKIANRSISQYSNKNIGWFFPNYGYKSGPKQSKRQSGYVGDDFIIIGNKNFNPRDLNFDKENNTAFTIQVHKIKNITDGKKGKPILKDLYAIRIHTPWDKQNSYFLYD
tara:strand:- start:965 stop:3397 length:2433 start_codon:yes stop_codon:yes gene_type:complete